MISITSSLLIGIVLLLTLLVLRGKTRAEESELSSELLPDGARHAGESCPAELVAQIFSSRDEDYIWGLKNSGLLRRYRRERRRVALLWVDQMAATIHLIMGEHAEQSRRSDDLEFVAEVQIFFQYLRLRMLCAVLSVLIQTAGPGRLGAFALYANARFFRFHQAQRSLLTSATLPEIAGTKAGR